MTTPAQEEARALAAYSQNSETFRSLNQLMWQIPLIAMTLTGGLWFGVSKVESSPGFRVALLFLALAGNIGLIIVLARLRYIMGEYLAWLKVFQPSGFVEARGRGLYAPTAVRTTFQIMLGLAAALSGVLMLSTAKQLPWIAEREASNGSLAFYDRHAKDLADSYEAVPFETTHPVLLAALAQGPSVKVLDVGAGTGRDAAALAAFGHDVTAVEPSDHFLRLARGLHPDVRIRWMKDDLPDLKTLSSSQARYRWIVLSAVWMHVRPDDRRKALKRLVDLLDADGTIYMTLRLGPAEPERAMHEVSVAELRTLAKQTGLELTDLGERPDLLGRTAVSWHTVTLARPRP